MKQPAQSSFRFNIPVFLGILCLTLAMLACGTDSLPFIGGSQNASPTAPPLPTLASSTETVTQTEADGSTSTVSGVATAVMVDSVQALVLESQPVQVSVLIRGTLPDDCSTITDLEQSYADGIFMINIVAARPAGASCNSVAVPFDRALDLEIGDLEPGQYSIDANGATATFQLGTPQPTADDSGGPPPTTNTEAGSILGVVWYDFCQVTEAGIPSTFCQDDGAGGYVPDQQFNIGEERIEGVTIRVAPGTCPATGDVFFTARTSSDGSFRLDNLAPGDYCLSVDENGEENRFILAEGSWTFPDNGVSSQSITVAAGASATANFGWAFASAPVPPVSIDPDCTDGAAFGADVTIPDNTAIAPGATFDKTWRLTNTGDCTWGLGYNLIFSDGEQMGAPTRVAIQETVTPGGSIDVTVTFTAPVTPGTYRSDWKLENPLGQVFGLGPANNTFYLQIVVNQSSGGSNTGGTGSGSGSGRINGVLWDDACVVSGGTPSAGCVDDGNGSSVANGIRDAGEAGIAGVIVTVSSGACTVDGRPAGNIQAIATTGADGAYTFENLAAGDYCVHIDQLAVDNAPRLLPGSWTAPDLGISGQTVAVSAGDTTTANFGWDSQE